MQSKIESLERKQLKRGNKQERKSRRENQKSKRTLILLVMEVVE